MSLLPCRESRRLAAGLIHRDAPRAPGVQGRVGRLVVLIASAAWMLVHAAAAFAEEHTGKVVGVADGDTITILRDKTPIKIRLQAVDAPEKAQPFGQKAKAFTSTMVFGKVVTVKVATRDKYGRTVAWVFVDGKSLNEELLRAGLAWHYIKYDKSKVLAALEQEARAAKRGLWADPNPTPPWVWRHRNDKAGEGSGKEATNALYHGNTKSKALHAPGCHDYTCKSCTARFKSVAEAEQAGYRPHRACMSPFDRCYSACLKRHAARAVGPEVIAADCRRRCERQSVGPQ